MQVVIDIPQKVYDKVLSGDGTGAVWAGYIKNGTPLPKEHGRLGDLDKLEREMYHKAFETDTDLQRWDSGCWIRYKMFEIALVDAPTIIEEDKEG